VSKTNDTIYKLDHILVGGLLLAGFVIWTEQAIDTTLTIRFLGVFGLLLTSFLLRLKRTVGYLKNGLGTLDLLLMAFCLWQIFSVLWATNTAEAFASGFRSIALFLSYLFFKVLLSSDHRWKVQLPFVVSLFSSLYLMLTWYGLIEIGQSSGLNAQTVYLLRYPTETKNLGSIFLMVSSVFHFQVFLAHNNWKKWYAVVNLLITLGTLFLFSTRGISVSFVAIGGVLFCVHFANRNLRFRWGIPVALGLKILGAVHWFSSNQQKTIAAKSYVEKSVSGSKELDDKSSDHNYRSGSERIALWQKTFELIKQDPILGVGAGNWQIEYPRNGLEGLERAEFRVTSFKRPHNEALWILSETGIVGLLLFLMVLGLFFLRAWKGGPDNFVYIAGMVGFIAASMFDFPRERMEHTLLFALLLASVENVSTKLKIEKPLSKIIFSGLLLLAVAGIIVNYMRLDGERNYDKLRILKAQEKYSECIRYADKVENPFYTVDWINYPIAWFVGICHTYQGDFVAGEKEFIRAIELNPGNFHTHNNLGYCLAQQEQYDKAIPFFKNSLAINSNFEEARFNLAYSLIMKNEPMQALEVLSENITDTVKLNVYLVEAEKLLDSSIPCKPKGK
jgi:O-antigen ligase